MWQMIYSKESSSLNLILVLPSIFERFDFRHFLSFEDPNVGAGSKVFLRAAAHFRFATGADAIRVGGDVGPLKDAMLAGDIRWKINWNVIISGSVGCQLECIASIG